MDNAVVVAPNLPMAVPAGFSDRLRALTPRARLNAVLGIAALIAILVTLSISSSQGDFRLLYANLSDKDGGAVLAQLAQMNVPYKVAPGGAIMVPAAQVPDLRLKLATAGLPKGSISGYELMDNARFGQTQFQERLTFQRGLEGELTRSITSLAAVQNARVHLALPNQNGFFREQQKPSASVLVSLHPGRSLDRAQVAGIVHMVSSSVPELDPKAVSVLDQTGALLTASTEGAQNAGLDARQLQYVNQVETGYAKRIHELLGPVVGRDNLRASVTADIDFTLSEATSEEWKPNQGPQASTSIRSQQTSEQSGAGSALPSGVPGAASNQPPVPATAPLAGAAQPLQGAPGAAGGASGRRDNVTNYEIDKTVRVTRNASGNVKRLNAAVVVNNRSVTDAKGKTTQVALTSDEIDKLTALVREGIGFREDRGDSVKIVNAPFRVEAINAVEVPWWKQPEILDFVRGAATPVALAIVAIVVFLGLIKPSARILFAPAQVMPEPAAALPGAQLNAVVDEDASFPGLSAPPPEVNQPLMNARMVARQNPAAVAGILRSWVDKEGGGEVTVKTS